MRIQTTISALLISLAIVPYLHGQAPAADTPSHQDAPNFVGVWRGQFDSLPGVDLVITNEGNQLQGAILFYLHLRPDVNSPYTSKPGLPEPVLNIRVMAGSLVFEVSQRGTHALGSLNHSPKIFRLKMTGPDQATLENESGGAPTVAMRRSDD